MAELLFARSLRQREIVSEQAVAQLWQEHQAGADHSWLLYRIADPGRGFAFDGLSHAAIANPEGGMAHAEIREARGIRPGGFGLVLIRAIADELVYNERQNEVLFVKYLDETATTS